MDEDRDRGILGSVDWTALHSRIVLAAEGALAARRRAARDSWWSPIARWSPVALPVGAVAALALAIGLSIVPATRSVGVEDVVVSSARATPSGDLLFAATPEAFAAAAIGDARTDR